MCGIAGIVEFGSEAVDFSSLLAMSRAIAHRGPDDEGYVLINSKDGVYREFSGSTSSTTIRARVPALSRAFPASAEDIGLCHRRFSIIDLSDGGHQPMFDSKRACCLVFNGEIYNYVELRSELESQGAAFRSGSDTEVLLAAYRHWGTDCFPKLNGFWALALYDFDKRRLILSRDRIGKKPLYWSRSATRLYFASEIKALLAVPELSVRRKVNERSAYQWLVYGRKDVDFTTCFQGIYSLPSACWAVADDEFPADATTFWRLPASRQKPSEISPGEAAGTLKDILQDAVRMRLRADVPIGVELSGGMDSSTLVALAAQYSSGPLTTYTVKFADKQYNEEPFARSVGNYYKTDYHVLEPSITTLWHDIRAFTYLEEEPYHSPNLHTNQVIWTQMRAMGTKVSLNGAAGDEDFGGYSGYFQLFQMENLLRGRFLTYLTNGIRYSAGRTNVTSLACPIAKLAATQLRHVAFLAGRQKRPPEYYKGPLHEPERDPTTLSEVLYDDMTNTLMPYWLRSGDRGYMGIPFEPRNPFLDYRVMELAFGLPITFLIRNGWQKWILRKAVEDLLPKEVIWRRKKLGYPFPYESFCKENDKLFDIILDRAENPYIDCSKRAALRANWKAVSFILWYELFFNDNAGLFRDVQNVAQERHAVEEYGFTPQFLTASRAA